MDFIGWLSIVSGIVGIAGFLFAVWVWLRSDTKVREITAVIQALHDIADSALWETQMLPGDDASGRLSQLEKSIGLVSAMRTLSAKYVGDHQSYRATELGALIQRGVIWSNAMLTGLETSSEVRSIWLVTPDLEPDMTEPKTGEVVKSNLAAGKSYVYFYPAALKSPDEKIRRLQRNIGADDPKRAKRVVFAPVKDGPTSHLILSRGNIILFFKDEPAYGTRLIFQEVVLNKIANRGLFWQECDRDLAANIYDMLRDELAPVLGTQP